MATVYTHPFYLFSLLVVVIFGVYSADGFKIWKKYLSFGLSMAVLIVFINIFVSPNGRTVLWEGKYLKITGEALCYGLNMGLKLILVLSIFCFYETALPADKAFRFFARLAPNSALVLILTSLFIPQLRRRVGDVKLAMAARGYSFEGRNLWRKISSHYPLLKIMLLSSLEDSWATAEALHARGFGLGKRNFYARDAWRKWDTIFSVIFLFSLVIFGISIFSHHGFYTFYPTMGALLRTQDIWFIFLLISSLSTVPFLNRILK